MSNIRGEHLLNFLENATPISLIVVTIDNIQLINLSNERIQLPGLEDVVEPLELPVPALLLEFPGDEDVLVPELRPVDVNRQTKLSNF